MPKQISHHRHTGGPAVAILTRNRDRPNAKQAMEHDANLSSDADDSEKLEAALESLRRWPRWNGRRCSGDALAAMLEGGGWQAEKEDGLWSCGRTGIIRFRVPLSRYAQRPRDLLLRIHGSYPETHSHSEVIVNGTPRGAHALNEAELDMAASELGRERELVLELSHAEPEGRATPRFRLQSLELVRT